MKKNPTVAWLLVKISPGARAQKILGHHGEQIKISIRAAPEKGKANEELISLLSNWLDIPKKMITITAGLTSRNKRVKIEGVSQEELNSLLSNLSREEVEDSKHDKGRDHRSEEEVEG